MEATVRSSDESNEEKLELVVSSIIRERVKDGQLDESPLSFKDIKVVQTTVYNALKGIYHTRIKYPKKEDD